MAMDMTLISKGRIGTGSKALRAALHKAGGRPSAALCLGVLAFFAFGSVLHAAFGAKSAGTSGAAFLKIGAGARPTAMGRAFTAVADDANTIGWNPAGLGTLKEKNEFVAMRAELFQDLNYNFFAFAHPTKKWGTIAVGLNNLNVTGIEQRSADTDNPDSTFSSNDSAYTMAYASKIQLERLGFAPFVEGSGLYAGGGLKLIRQTLAGETANSVAADLGLLYRLDNRPLSFGFAVQNLGSSSKFKRTSDPLPLTLKFGSSYRFGENWKWSGVPNWEQSVKNGFLVAADVNSPRDNDPSFHFGSEFTYGWTDVMASSVRAGYETGKARQYDSTATGVSAGAGFTYKLFTFDFAWVPFGDLGDTFRYSVKLRF
ncbi:MAG: hypothetical protein A2902_04915 [Elusimicrobia bacterium RIFCSPLOWO2_01_FULL_64_13]|nr:MAG: hypothetical protein A2636_02205 [Elusimicrobia bacterium RIFCSPHIGHO2_01_FULL_64_10]OGR95688.1 MAG: hypothetical protein A2902_04915 [Elusimicrobia bacterium RIFCSPLOWO2_01_FULL_64_13]